MGDIALSKVHRLVDPASWSGRRVTARRARPEVSHLRRGGVQRRGALRGVTVTGALMAAAVTIFQGSVTPVFEVGLGLEKT